MIVWQERPYNAEPPPDALLEPLTATDAFYVRTHGEVPRIDPDGHRLELCGLVERALSLTPAALADSFPSHTVTATLECAGNRRAELMALRDINGEIPWRAQVLGTARWTGVSLADVLAEAGVRDGARHVELLGADRSAEADCFGGSIPLRKATSPEVLLAWSMNDTPLPELHGGPLRAVVPGYIGARSVKWLRQVRVLDRPSSNHFQAVSYRLHPPRDEKHSADPEAGIPLGELSVNSAILTPEDGARLRPGRAEVRGWAITGGDSRIARVDVSVDEGHSWETATLGPDQGRWAWRLWRHTVSLPPGESLLVCRAFDSAANTQPESVEQLWNFQGYANNAWSRVRVTAA